MTLEEKRMMIMVLVRSCTYTRWNSKIYALFIKVSKSQIKQTKTVLDKEISKRSYVLMTLEEKRMMIMVLVRSCTNTRWNLYKMAKVPDPRSSKQANKQTRTIPDEILSKRSYVLMTLKEKRMMIMVLVRSCTNTRWNSKIYALLAL
jgi:hypothetical protein